MGTKHMIKTPTHFADVLYNEVLQKILFKFASLG